MMGPEFATAGCGPIVFFIGFLLIGFLFFYLLKNKKKSNESYRPDSGHGTMDQLEMRLARGEITTEEYQRVKETLIK